MADTLPVGNRVRAMRESHGAMSQSDLGKAVGVTRQTIAAIEQRRYAPSLETAFRIANLFDTEIGEVFFWDPQ
ncbi:helix-turn-helix transcriptional regulator [Alteromonas antoniana]|uniref:helix-turn-helix transcriptional regulator n=1 Tax=Alteromonas antoniana TaxID=2803813 RepID=UPI001C46882B|nr:helix-turn-helix transcriptional regulator [Alteromonas antoniana]